MRAMSWRRVWAALALSTLAMLPTLASPRPDLVFHAPEVVVRHAASSKSVGTGRAAGSALVEPYEEFFIEHDVSTADAKKAARALNLSSVARAPAGCGTCSARELAYCGAALVGDHCCCERRYAGEPLPWVPHTCYAGRAPCRLAARDCALYTRLRDCCCLASLAAHWKGILSACTRAQASMTSLLLLSSLTILNL